MYKVNKTGGFHAREKRNGIFSLVCVVFAMMGLPGCAQRAARRDTKGLFSWRALSEGRGGALLELAQSQDITEFNGTLIISGAFGLFKEDTVVAAGGYDAGTLGEDMELVVKLHVYCRNNRQRCSIRYEPNAVCWSQAPSNMKDLMKQRRLWHLGLSQSMTSYPQIFANPRFGLVSWVRFSVSSRWVWPLALFFEFSVYGTVFCAVHHLRRSDDAYHVFSAHLHAEPADHSAGRAARAVDVPAGKHVFRYGLSFLQLNGFIGCKKKRTQWVEHTGKTA